MKKQVLTIILTIATVIGFSVPVVSDAQFLNGIDRLRPYAVSLSITPQHPQPGQEITATVSVVGLTIRNKTIVWYQDGRVVQRSLGNNQYRFEAPPAGSDTTIRAVIARTGKSNLEQSITIRPADIDLMWEADSYTPPFYKGKALHAPTGDAYVIAQPQVFDSDGNRITNNDLHFTWVFNGSRLPTFSGFGRNIFKTDVSPRENTITVEVATREGKTAVTDRITIPNADPQAFLYVVDPLDGILFNKPVTHKYELEESEFTLQAYPFYFNTSDASVDDLEYQWYVNNRRVQGVVGPTITLNAAGKSGASRISTQIIHPEKVFHQAEEGILVRFEQQEDENNNEEQ